MKTTVFLTTAIAGAFLFATAANVAAQATGGGTAGAAAAGAGAAGAARGRIMPARPVPPVAVQPNHGAPIQNPALQNRNTVQPGITSQATDTLTTNPTAMATNALPGTNALAANTNVLNQPFGVGNEAVTPSDRVLLGTLLQGVQVQLGLSSTAQLPVHFIISNGSVTITGVVRNANERDRIFARVQKTPGVLSAFDDLQIGNGTAAGTAATAQTRQPTFFTTVGDHAFSPADQTILTSVQQQVAAQLGVNGSSTVQMPIHFSIENGVVGVTGRLASLPEKQAVFAAIQRIPGVVRVVDDVALTTPATGGVNATFGQNPTTAGGQNPFMTNTNLSPTSANPNQTNSRVFQNNTNRP